MSIKPNSFAQIAEIAQSTKVVIMRENKERQFSKQPDKRKEAMMVTASTHDRKRRAHEAYRSSNWVPGKENGSYLIQGT